MPIRSLKLAPGPGFWTQTAEALVADYPQGFATLQVLVPAFSHATLLKQALAARLGRVFIAPRINTVSGWLAQHALRAEAVPPADSARLMGLYAELRQHGWLKKLFSARSNTDLLPLADMLLTLSDELTRALLPQALASSQSLDERWEQALAQLSPPSRKLLSDEAQLVWSIWKGQLERNDKTALRHAGMLALAETATDDLAWISPVAPEAMEQAFLDKYAERRPVTAVLLDWDAARLPALYRRAWAEMPDAPAAAAEEGAEPFWAGLGEGEPADVAMQTEPEADDDEPPETPEGLFLMPCLSLEHEAQQGAQTVIDWLAGGKQCVAIVAQDRVVTRRIRALLDRAQIRVMDETGWKLSTTRAAAVIVAWLDIVSTRADTVALLDFLKSPYVCARLHGKARQLMMLETVLRRANITGGWRAVLAATARAQAKHELAADARAAREAGEPGPLQADVHDTEHDYVMQMLAQRGFGERDSAGVGFGDRDSAWREVDFSAPVQDEADFLAHDPADFDVARDFGHYDDLPLEAGAADFGSYSEEDDGMPLPGIPPELEPGEPVRSRFALDDEKIAPEGLTVFKLVSHIASQAMLFTGQRTIAEWGELMQDTLQLFGMTHALADDEAGRQVLDLLASLDGGPDAGTHFSFNEWRACIAGEFEATAFIAPGADPRVVMLPLNGARLRAFDAVLVAGSDSAHLPSSAPETLFFANAVRRELGLETRESRQRQQMRDLCEVLLANPEVVLSWQAHKEGEPNPVSPWIERLQLQLARAGRPPLAVHEADIGRRALFAALPAMPAPSAPGLLPAKLSASAYNTFIACPYQFFVTRMLRLSGVDELSDLPEKRDYGDWLHTILKTYHEALQQAPVQDRLALITDISERVFADELARSAAALGYYARWRKVIPAYLAWAEAREKAGWQFAFGERAFERPLAFDGGEVLLAGRIDRIDRHADGGHAVLDYKTTTAGTLKNRLRNMEDHQLPFYGLLSGLDVQAAAYVALEAMGGKTGDAEAHDYPRWQLALEQHIAGSMSALAQGKTIPANGIASVCQYCEVRGMCRKGAW